MGYYAKGYGSAILKSDVNREMEETLKTIDTDIEWDVSDTEINFWESDSHWHEEDTFEFLRAITPYITEGCAVYSGEDDSVWRYIYEKENDTWVEQCATIDFNFESFSDEELIKELEKRGYKVA